MESLVPEKWFYRCMGEEVGPTDELSVYLAGHNDPFLEVREPNGEWEFYADWNARRLQEHTLRRSDADARFAKEMQQELFKDQLERSGIEQDSASLQTEFSRLWLEVSQFVASIEELNSRRAAKKLPPLSKVRVCPACQGRGGEHFEREVQCHIDRWVDSTWAPCWLCNGAKKVICWTES